MQQVMGEQKEEQCLLATVLLETPDEGWEGASCVRKLEVPSEKGRSRAVGLRSCTSFGIFLYFVDLKKIQPSESDLNRQIYTLIWCEVDPPFLHRSAWTIPCIKLYPHICRPAKAIPTSLLSSYNHLEN